MCKYVQIQALPLSSWRDPRARSFAWACSSIALSKNNIEQLENGNAMECWRFPTATGRYLEWFGSTFWSWERSIMSVSLPWHTARHNFHSSLWTNAWDTSWIRPPFDSKDAIWRHLFTGVPNSLPSGSCPHLAEAPSPCLPLYPSEHSACKRQAFWCKKVAGLLGCILITLWTSVDWICDFIFPPYNEIDDVRGFRFNCWRSKEQSPDARIQQAFGLLLHVVDLLSPQIVTMQEVLQSQVPVPTLTHPIITVYYISILYHSNPSPINILRDFAKSSILWKLPVAQYFWHLLTFTMVA